MAKVQNVSPAKLKVCLILVLRPTNQHHRLFMRATLCRSYVGTGQAVLHGYAERFCSTVGAEFVDYWCLDHSIQVLARQWLHT
jgi:hypothetical protein